MLKTPTTLLSKYSNLLLTIYQFAQELPVSQFQNAILFALKDSLPFDTAIWGTGTMTAAGIDPHSTHLYETSTAMMLAYDRVKHQDSAAAQVTQRPTMTIAINTDSDLGGLDQKELREFCHEFGHRNTLITCDINPITKFTQWISLYRRDPRQICSENEKQVVASLAPHLMQALAINQIIHLDKLSGDIARERWCVASADTRGIIYHAAASFWLMVCLKKRWPSNLSAHQRRFEASCGKSSGNWRSKMLYCWHITSPCVSSPRNSCASSATCSQ